MILGLERSFVEPKLSMFLRPAPRKQVGSLSFAGWRDDNRTILFHKLNSKEPLLNIDVTAGSHDLAHYSFRRFIRLHLHQHFSGLQANHKQKDREPSGNTAGMRCALPDLIGLAIGLAKWASR